MQDDQISICCGSSGRKSFLVLFVCCFVCIVSYNKEGCILQFDRYFLGAFENMNSKCNFSFSYCYNWNSISELNELNMSYAIIWYYVEQLWEANKASHAALVVINKNTLDFSPSTSYTLSLKTLRLSQVLLTHLLAHLRLCLYFATMVHTRFL